MEERIERDFTYHAPKVGQPERYVELRDMAKALALKIIALTHLRKIPSMWTSAYFVSTIDHVSTDTIQQYITEQSSRS